MLTIMSYLSTVECSSPCTAGDCELGCLPNSSGVPLGSGSYLTDLSTTRSRTWWIQTSVGAGSPNLPASWKSPSAPVAETRKPTPPAAFRPPLLWHVGANVAFQGQLHYYPVPISSSLPGYLPNWLSIFFLMSWNFPYLLSPSSAAKHVQNYSN